MGACAAERCEGRLAVEPVDVLTGGDQQLPGVAGGDSERLDGAGSGGGDELLELLVKMLDLVVEGVDPVGEGSQREFRSLDGVAEVAGGDPEAGADRCLAAERLALGELSRSGCGAVMIRSRICRVAVARALTALLRATRSIRIASMIPSVCFGVTFALPASMSRAAISASMGSLLPTRRRVWAWGWLTSTPAMLCSRR
jgi:hypothetical protein